MISEHDKKYMSKNDLKLAVEYTRDYDSGNCSAHNRLEAIRNKYGYSGGYDGSQFICLYYEECQRNR